MKPQLPSFVRAVCSFGTRYWPWLIPQIAALVFFIVRLEKRKPWKTQWKERVAEGLIPRLNDYIDTGFWYAALFGVIVSVLLIATTPIWSKALTKGVQRFTPVLSKRDNWFYFLALALILAGALLLRLPRMEHSLWGDEEWAARKYIIGNHKEDNENGALVFERVKWKETLYFNRMANNHILQSSLSRISLNAWQEMKGLPRWEFDEAVLRLPALIAGLATLALVAIFFRIIHLPVAGFLAAAFLAIHPWHIRYSTEARGYSLTQLGLVALLICVVMLSRNPRWLWVVLGALASVVTALSWPGSLIFLVMIHAGILAIFWFGRDRSEKEIPPALRRWLAVHLFIAPWLAFVLFPNIPQIQHQISTSGMFTSSLDLQWFKDTGALILSGTLWKNHEAGNSVATALSMYYPKSAEFWIGLGVAIVALLAFAIRNLIQRGEWRIAVLLASSLLGGFAMIALALVRCHYLYYWYLTPLLPIMVILIVLGIIAASSFIVRSLSRNDRIASAFASVVILLGVTGYANIHKPITQLMQDHPVEDLRGAAAHTRMYNHWPEKKRIETVLFWRGAKLYDPYAHVKFTTMAEFLELAQRCCQEKRPMHVAVGMMPAVAQEFPLVASTLRNPDIFEIEQILYGTEARYTLQVFRLKPSPDMAQLQLMRGMALYPERY